MFSIMYLEKSKAMIYTSLKTGQSGEIAAIAMLYPVKCNDTPKYATHRDENGNLVCFYGTSAVFDGKCWVELN